MLVAQSCLILWDPMDCSLTDSSVPGISQARTLDGLPLLSPEDLSDPGIKPRSPALQADSLWSETAGKPIAWLLLTFSKSPSTHSLNVKFTESVVFQSLGCYHPCTWILLWLVIVVSRMY